MKRKEKTTRNRNDAAMSILEFKGNWNIAKGKLKQQFARWTDDEQQFTEGKENELVGRIQKRNQRARSEAAGNVSVSTK